MNAAGPEGIDLSLTTTDRERRRKVNGIVDSYNHSCDVLAELLQNAVDAIRMHVREHGEAVRDTHENPYHRGRTFSVDPHHGHGRGLLVGVVQVCPSESGLTPTSTKIKEWSNGS